MNDLHRTMFAQAGSDLASEFEDASRGLPACRLKLATLEMSTDGGKLARQSMMMEPVTGGAAAVFGWVNLAERRGELRDHRLVAEAYEERTKQKFFMTRPQFDEALAVVDMLLKRQKVEFTRVVPASAPAGPGLGGRAEPPPPAKGGGGAIWVLLALLILAGGGAGYYFYFMK